MDGCCGRKQRVIRSRAGITAIFGRTASCSRRPRRNSSFHPIPSLARRIGCFVSQKGQGNRRIVPPLALWTSCLFWEF
ncbi:hypothetical protein C8R47DRAFT_1192336 [Mycena vitilis]|nr:hypothetical protein C8R47DRAFT_1192336 [Mycena vitilis]